jgi:hypothetical protein
VTPLVRATHSAAAASGTIISNSKLPIPTSKLSHSIVAGVLARAGARLSTRSRFHAKAHSSPLPELVFCGGAMKRRAVAPRQRPAGSRPSSRRSPMSAWMRSRWSTRTMSSTPRAQSSLRSMACSSG